VSCQLVSSLAPEFPIMDEVKSTPAPTALNRDRLTGIIWSATRAQALPLIIGMVLCALMALPLVHSVVRGEVGVGEISFFALFLALAFLVLSAFTVVLPAFLEWSGFGRWARRRGAEQHKKRFAALGDAHRAPFQLEQRSKLSATEEVWVRDARTPQSNKVLLEVLYTRDSCQTWDRLPLRLSPLAWFKCIAYQGEWPATPRTRHLSCDKGCISFEVLDLCADNWETWPIVWRATYRPRWRWWTLKAIGSPWPGTLSQGTGVPPPDPSRPRNA
jgi:hypothetical protein